MFRSNCSLKALFVCLYIALLSAPVAAQPAKLKWTDNTEKTTIDAEFVRMADAAVILKKDGKEITVPLAKLSMASHLQALKLAKPEAYAKAAPKAVIGIEQTAESTKLLNESPFKENQTIEEFMDALNAEMEKGNFTAAWHALTPEMQADVEDIVVAAVETGGKGMLVQIRSLMKNVGIVVKEKKEFIFASPLAQLDAKRTRELQTAWPQVELITEALTDKTNWDSANFKAGNVGPWIAAITAKMGNAFVKTYAIAEKAGAPELKKLMAYKVISQSGDSATVQQLFTPPPTMNPQTRQMVPSKQPEPEEYVRVSGRWLPKTLVEKWKEHVAEAKGQVDFAMPVVSNTLTIAIPIVSSLANAKTQQEFNVAVQQIMVSLQGLSGAGGRGGAMPNMQGGNFGGGMAPPSAMPAPGGGMAGASGAPALPGGKGPQ